MQLNLKASNPLVLRLIGVGALFTTSGIHLDLYATGYRLLPRIGMLFLLQSASGIILGLTLLIRPTRLIAAAGAIFAASTIAGYIASRAIGVFGFHEVRTSAGFIAGVVESVAVFSLGLFVANATARAPRRAPSAITRMFDELWQRRTLVKSITLGASTLALALSVAVATGGTTPRSSRLVSATSTASMTIVITNFAFVPNRATVLPGERVMVKNDDSVVHTLTSTATTATHPLFDTGDIQSGSLGSFIAPMRAGTYPYVCSVHNFMTGQIIVRR